MANQIKLKIATPEKVILDEVVESVLVPTTEGEVGILPGHVPLVSSLSSGDIVAIQNGEQIPMAVVGGFVEVKRSSEGSEVIILADFAEHVSEMSDEEIATAKARAEKMSSEQDKVSKEDFEHFEAELERAFTRAKIHGKWKSKKYRKLPQAKI